MSDYYSQYKQKLRTASQIVEMIQDNWYICAGQFGGGPPHLFSKLHEIKGRAKNVTLQTSLVLGNYPFLNDPEMKDWLRYEAWFYGANERRLHPGGIQTIVPMHLSQGVIKQQLFKKPKMFWGVSAPMDKHGNFNIAYGIAFERDIVDRADIVVLEVNENAPRTLGENTVNIRDIDYFVESNAPRIEVPVEPTSGLDLTIGKYIADLVEDRSTIQLGIGNIPNAVALNFKDKKDLGIHTEMITDSMAELYKMGVITNKYKGIYEDKIVGTFVFGSKELYEFVDDNPVVQLVRGKTTNDPCVVAKNDNMVSINTAIQIDLTGQVCSESIGIRQYSGIGGQFDTSFGAQRSKGGKSFIALHSTAKNDTISTIVPALDRGTVVTLGRNDVDYVVTEYGVAHLKGISIRERVEALINIAHPKFRDDLQKEADRLNIW